MGVMEVMEVMDVMEVMEEVMEVMAHIVTGTPSCCSRLLQLKYSGYAQKY